MSTSDEEEQFQKGEEEKKASENQKKKKKKSQGEKKESKKLYQKIKKSPPSNNIEDKPTKCKKRFMRDPGPTTAPPETGSKKSLDLSPPIPAENKISRKRKIGIIKNGE